MQSMPAGKRPLLVNLDETFLPFAQAGAAGNRVHVQSMPEHGGVLFRESIRAKHRRGGIARWLETLEATFLLDESRDFSKSIK